MSAPSAVIDMERYQELISIEKELLSGKLVPKDFTNKILVKHRGLWGSGSGRYSELEYEGRDSVLTEMNNALIELRDINRSLKAQLSDKDADNVRVKLFEEGSFWFRLKCAFKRCI
jgi:hypothetical protein